MSSPQPAFDTESLKRVEQVYRRQLLADPANTVARISLAWCLFMQALLRAGQESVLTALAGATEGGDHRLDDAIRSILDDDAELLLEDCLRQTMTVMQLSSDPAAHHSAERIQALVKLSGGGQALSEAEDEATRILNEVTREIMARTDAPKTTLRRLPTSRKHAG